MQLPKRLEDGMNQALDRLEIARREEDSRLTRQPGRAASLAKLAESKRGIYDALLEASEAVLAWREDFLRTRPAQRLWQLLGADTRVTIYRARYHDGHAVPADVDVAWTEIVLTDPAHHFRMEEWTIHRTRPRRSTRLVQPRDLVEYETLHPRMLLDLRDFLAGPDRFAYIEETLLAEAERVRPTDSMPALKTHASRNG